MQGEVTGVCVTDGAGVRVRGVMICGGVHVRERKTLYMNYTSNGKLIFRMFSILRCICINLLYSIHRKGYQ